MMAQRLQKILAQSGLGSRRACEELIRLGRVQVNGVTAELGQRADRDRDEILVDGKSIAPAQEKIYIALYKPVGYLSSLRSQGGNPTIRELVHIPERVYPVGRLDLDSEGLMLLTNDGELTHQLTHPRFGHLKEYRVLLDRAPDEGQLKAWREGIVLPDGSMTLEAQVNEEDPQSGESWVRVRMREGRKRQIRATAQVLGYQVHRLIRVRIGPLHLGRLQAGESRRLSEEEVGRLRSITSG
jgi:23S rRNA pseudouridine2605 synthase